MEKFSNIIFSEPQFIEMPIAWIEHIPFAFFLVEKLKPKTIVELGTHYGNSYFAFCQAIKELKISTKAYAIDSWTGDEHAGFYGNEVFNYVNKINNEHFSYFSNLIKATFDEASQYFENGSIDLLHIDGLHTYEAVKHDFENWLPKMSDKGVIIFHDTVVKERGFGVWKLVEEISTRYPYFQFEHGYGLGVLCVGKNVDTKFVEFVSKEGNESFTQKLFENAGKRIWFEQQFQWQKSQIEVFSNNISANNQTIKLKDNQIEELRKKVCSKESDIDEQGTQLHALQQNLLIKDTRIADLQDQINELNTLKNNNDHLKDKVNAISVENEKMSCLITEKDHELTQLKNKLSHLGSVSQEQSVQMEHIQLLIDQLTKSASWKLTAPLRYLKRKVKTSYFFISRNIRLIEKSELFDEKYYLEHNPDVASTGMLAAKHYLLFGGFEGRKPSEKFDSSFYLQQNPDVKVSGMNPLFHYLKTGNIECRSSLPEKSIIFTKVEKSLKSKISEVDQISKKLIERLQGFPEVQLIRNSKYFDSEYYLNMNPDLKLANIDLVEHYLFHGWKEGRNPSEIFNTNFYLNEYEDVQRSNMNPLIHYIKYGELENRHCSEKSGNDYLLWIKKYDSLSSGDIEEMKQSISLFDDKPLISVIMPVFNSNPVWLKEAINSVIHQVYPFWELCLADDCSSDKEIKEILEFYRMTDSRIKVIYRTSNGHISAASNSALTLASGEFVALLDHDDILPTHALFWVANAINQNPGIKLIYSDEDKIDENGVRQDPYFKCDWNPELFYSQNMISHLGVYQTEIIRKIGGFRTGFEGSQDYDLALRFIEQIDPREIFHISKILYHWRLHENSTSYVPESKDYAYIAGENALNEHFKRTAKRARANISRPGLYRLTYQLIESAPHITLIIPTKNQSKLLRNCIQSILQKTAYTAYDILIVDNDSDEEGFFRLLNELKTEKRFSCINNKNPFNYSAINNQAISGAKGEYVCLLNNDIEVINANWLDEMVAIAMQPGIGAVGAKLYYPDDRIQHAGVILGLGGVAGHAHKFLSSKAFGYFGRAALMQEMSAVTGACLLVKRNIYLEVGGMDDINLAVAFNDVDFCLRLKKAGYRNIWTPYAELYHYESATRGMDDTEIKNQRFSKEVAFMKETWGNELQIDPAYNPNLSLSNENFELAWPPRNILLNDKCL